MILYISTNYLTHKIASKVIKISITPFDHQKVDPMIPMIPTIPTIPTIPMIPMTMAHQAGDPPEEACQEEDHLEDLRAIRTHGGPGRLEDHTVPQGVHQAEDHLEEARLVEDPQEAVCLATINSPIAPQ